MLSEMEDPYITSSKIHTDDVECLDWLKWSDVEYGDIFMPRWAEPPEAYGSRFVYVCMYVSVCLSVGKISRRSLKTKR